MPPVQSNSPSEASLRRDFVLSQDRYGSKTSISLPWNDFPVPGLAVGRLVETASEIAGLIDAYVADRLGRVAANLARDGLRLPRGRGECGQERARRRYRRRRRCADHAERHVAAGSGVVDRRRSSARSCFGSRHDVIFLAGHFSANSALAADFATSVLTTDLAAAPTDFANSIVFSAGCHAGYNLVDGDAIPGVTLPLDWAQAFARKGATLIAGTGYQYGDTDFLEYSERLYNDFARQLRAGARGDADRGRRGAGAGEARLPRRHARHPRPPREGAARGDAVRPADARREHAIGSRRYSRHRGCDRSGAGRRGSRRDPRPPDVRPGRCAGPHAAQRRCS